MKRTGDAEERERESERLGDSGAVGGGGRLPMRTLREDGNYIRGGKEIFGFVTIVLI